MLPHHAGAGPTECKLRLTVLQRFYTKVRKCGLCKKGHRGDNNNDMLAWFWSNTCGDGWGPSRHALVLFLVFCWSYGLFVCFRVLHCLVDLVLSHTSPLGFRGGWGCQGQTSGFCVSPPAPDAAMPPSPPGTSRKCPRLQTPVSQNKQRLLCELS